MSNTFNNSLPVNPLEAYLPANQLHYSSPRTYQPSIATNAWEKVTNDYMKPFQFQPGNSLGSITQTGETGWLDNMLEKFGSTDNSLGSLKNMASIGGDIWGGLMSYKNSNMLSDAYQKQLEIAKENFNNQARTTRDQQRRQGAVARSQGFKNYRPEYVKNIA